MGSGFDQEAWLDAADHLLNVPEIQHVLPDRLAHPVEVAKIAGSLDQLLEEQPGDHALIHGISGCGGLIKKRFQRETLAMICVLEPRRIRGIAPMALSNGS